MGEENETLQGFLENAIKLSTDAAQYLLEKEVNKGLGMINKIIPMGLTNKLLPYFAAAGILDLSGKDITKSDIERLLNAGDVDVNRTLLEGIGMLHYRNHLVYILGIVLLVSAEKEVTMERLLNVAIALDIDPDVGVAREAADVYNELAPKHGFPAIPKI
ncbi:MAG: hypothetical protein M1360_02405 [Candidatus Marsarchaeota archaeon]|jgi:ribosomal protein L12E/L44/L45/RPP1/RPP2|nr:hypothetical protein [Candidatus Marsarchaeota archaeon]MCL5418770.1 hypothetical protein [Candidatus Marsarchaeota archaeon]